MILIATTALPRVVCAEGTTTISLAMRTVLAHKLHIFHLCTCRYHGDEFVVVVVLMRNELVEDR
jgi:hypothetical protein